MLNLVFRNPTSDKKYSPKIFEKILKTAARELKLKGKLELSVNLVGEAKMRELNKKYRKKDKPTDVLSFPLGDGSGDIFICLSIAKSDAKRENVDIKTKLAQLTVHGFLHLQGYDHARSKRDAREMFDLEAKILNKMGGL